MSDEPITNAELDSFVRDSCRSVAIAVLEALRIADRTPEEIDTILFQKKGTTRRQINRLINGDGSKITTRFIGEIAYATEVRFDFHLMTMHKPEVKEQPNG